jgi:hypothetical protein
LIGRDLLGCIDHHSLFKPVGRLSQATYAAREEALADSCGDFRVLAVIGFLEAQWHRRRKLALFARNDQLAKTAQDVVEVAILFPDVKSANPEKMAFISSCAKCWPMHICGPRPNAICSADPRVTSNLWGSENLRAREEAPRPSPLLRFVALVP